MPLQVYFLIPEDTNTWKPQQHWRHVWEIPPASTTHRQLSDEQRASAGAASNVVRLSIGIEDVKDLINDMDQALTKATS